MSNAIIIPIPFLALSAAATLTLRGRTVASTPGSGAHTFPGARA